MAAEELLIVCQQRWGDDVCAAQLLDCTQRLPAEHLLRNITDTWHGRYDMFTQNPTLFVYAFRPLLAQETRNASPPSCQQCIEKSVSCLLLLAPQPAAVVAQCRQVMVVAVPTACKAACIGPPCLALQPGLASKTAAISQHVCTAVAAATAA